MDRGWLTLQPANATHMRIELFNYLISGWVTT